MYGTGIIGGLKLIDDTCIRVMSGVMMGGFMMMHVVSRGGVDMGSLLDGRIDSRVLLGWIMLRLFMIGDMVVCMFMVLQLWLVLFWSWGRWKRSQRRDRRYGWKVDLFLAQECLQTGDVVSESPGLVLQYLVVVLHDLIMFQIILQFVDMLFLALTKSTLSSTVLRSTLCRGKLALRSGFLAISGGLGIRVVQFRTLLWHAVCLNSHDWIEMMLCRLLSRRLGVCMWRRLMGGLRLGLVVLSCNELVAQT